MTAETTVTSQADVATDTPERYLKQLVSHLSRGITSRETDDGTELVFDSVLEDGTCLMRARPGVLELRAAAGSTDVLARVEEIVGSHLERFGARNELTVTWSRD